MPDLGPYAVEVGLAYVVSLTLLAGIVILSVWQSRRMRRRLGEAEERRRDG